jgi:hypothetical protein
VAELRRRGLAEQDGAGLFHARGADCVFGGHVVVMMQGAEGRAHAGGVHQVLGGEGNAVQQAERLALHDGVFSLFGGGARLIGDDGDEAVQHGLKFLGAGEDGVGEFDGRDLLGRDLLAQDRGGQTGKFTHFSSPRAARLRISADTPKVHGATLSQ